MLVELMALHARVLKRMPIALAVLAIGLGLIVMPHVPALQVASWGALVVAIECGRAACGETVLQRGKDIDPQRVHHVFIVLAAIAGAAVGFGAWTFFPQVPIIDQALIGIVFFAVPAAGVTAAVSSKNILAMYALGILVPTAGRWITAYSGYSISISLLTALYWGFLVSVAADNEKLLLRTVILRQQRDRMLANLEHTNKELIAATDRAERAAQARARVLAAASHDLRQPLHALSLYSAMLAAKPGEDMLQEVADNIDRIVRSLGGMLSNLLDLSRLSVGQYVPEQQVFALDRLIGEICEEFSSAADAKKLQFVRELSPLRLRGDSIAIARIARNLIDNAIKYCDQGEIRVQLDARDAHAILTVTDTGRGIPQAEQARIFEEFYQIDNPGRDRSKGVGLGLAIVQRLCELIGANISVASEVGAGTCFAVRIAGLIPHSIAAEQVSPTVSAEELHGKRVYVVDDEIDIRRSMQALLQSWRINADVADGSVTLDALFATQGVPDVLIADLRLGKDEHGAELAHRLRQQYGQFAVVIITGETASSALESANAAGFSILQKPVSPERLRDALRTALHDSYPEESSPLENATVSQQA
ncbi:MAG: ATP-binding protein [Gammaproteobacteria bacterium]